MKILFHSPHQEAAAWRDQIAHALPEAELRAWQRATRPPPTTRSSGAHRANSSRRATLRAIFNLGAGVDALLALEHAHPGAAAPCRSCGWKIRAWRSRWSNT